MNPKAKETIKAALYAAVGATLVSLGGVSQDCADQVGRATVDAGFEAAESLTATTATKAVTP